MNTGTDTGTNALPLTAAKDYAAPSLFEPANLLREARRQKNLRAAKADAIPGGPATTPTCGP